MLVSECLANDPLVSAGDSLPEEAAVEERGLQERILVTGLAAGDEIMTGLAAEEEISDRVGCRRGD